MLRRAAVLKRICDRWMAQNAIEQLVLAENQSLETTKDKKDKHGMGHLIVEEQVKRLGGMVEYYEDEMFCAHVYLPM